MRNSLETDAGRGRHQPEGALKMTSSRMMTLRSSAAMAALMLFAAPAMAQVQEQTYRFDIPAEDLGDALRAFAQTAHQQIIFCGDCWPTTASPSGARPPVWSSSKAPPAP